MNSPGPQSDRNRPVEDLEQLSLIRQANVLLRHRRLIAVWALVLPALVVVATLMWPRSYRVDVSVMPGSASSAANLAGLAAQFGFSVSADDAGQSPAFYASLLTADRALRELVSHRYGLGDSAAVDSTDLIAYYRLDGVPRAAGIERAVDKLRRDVSATTNLKTNVVTLSVTLRKARLAYAVADEAVRLIERFNLEQRQTQAGAERRFLESRLDSAQAEMNRREEALAEFLKRNRQFENSPELSFQNDRLRRAIDLQQQVVVSLAQAFEKARLDEIRNTPLISIVDPPQLPARPEPRGLGTKVVAALILGLLCGVALAYLREALVRARAEDPASFADFQALSSAAWSWLARRRTGSVGG